MTSKILASLAAALIAFAPALADSPAVDPSTAADPATGIRVPAGYTATVFGDQFGFTRHIVVADSGWLYTALRAPQDGFGGAALYDSDGDGVADKVEYFAEGSRGSGIGIYGGYLYYGENQRILRWKLPTSGAPKGVGEVVVDGFPAQRAHAAKTMAFDGAGQLYVNVGVPSNNCMVQLRTKGSPGQDPCPELELHGGIWRFDANTLGQDFAADGFRHATGLRNGVAIAWNPVASGLYVAQHGRDQLGQFFPEYYSDADSAELPAEEFHRVEEGDNLGWPYSYYDHRIGARMKAPEYGGDGKTVSDIGKKPVLAFPGHWAPNGVTFLSHGANKDLHGGALIAFHGSWNRAPLVQKGYRVVYVPMDETGKVTGDWTTFVDGFPGVDEVVSPSDAKHRPIGLAEGPDGAIYISSTGSRDHAGRIWRLTRAQ